ncbi:MAG TPA: DUF599 domain-containing protein [Methylibium sp.]|nr:DUF599 domain-containing protein [Methylibium sp.]
MDQIVTLVKLLPWADWAALVWFLVAWIGYARFAVYRSRVRPSVLVATNLLRHQWMLQVTKRDVRIVDGAIVQSLANSPAFFASTTILIIGGLLAVLGTSEKATELVSELPFAARTPVLVFDFKLLVLTALFVYAFFRFTWSIRQYGFGAMLVGAAPEAREFLADPTLPRELYARRAAHALSLAAETFTDGLRSYYMAFAMIGWFVSPLVFALATVGVIVILYEREFHSEILAVLREL